MCAVLRSLGADWGAAMLPHAAVWHTLLRNIFLRAHIFGASGCSPSEMVGKNIYSVVDVLSYLKDELPSILAKMAQKVCVCVCVCVCALCPVTFFSVHAASHTYACVCVRARTRL